MRCPDVQTVAGLIRQHAFLDQSGRAKTDLCSVRLFCSPIVAIRKTMAHVCCRRHDQDDDDKTSQRAKLARLRRESAVYTADDFIRLRGFPDFFFALPRLPVFEVERLCILPFVATLNSSSRRRRSRVSLA